MLEGCCVDTKVARQSPAASLESLTRKAMDFFERVTVPLTEPELIIVYSSGLGTPSAAKFCGRPLVMEMRWTMLTLLPGRLMGSLLPLEAEGTGCAGSTYV